MPVQVFLDSSSEPLALSASRSLRPSVEIVFEQKLAKVAKEERKRDERPRTSGH